VKGKFAFPNAADGPYTVIAELNGFGSAEVKGTGAASLTIPMELRFEESSAFG